MLEIKPTSTVCKANTLSVVLFIYFLPPPSCSIFSGSPLHYILLCIFIVCHGLSNLNVSSKGPSCSFSWLEVFGCNVWPGLSAHAWKSTASCQCWADKHVEFKAENKEGLGCWKWRVILRKGVAGKTNIGPGVRVSGWKERGSRKSSGGEWKGSLKKREEERRELVQWQMPLTPSVATQISSHRQPPLYFVCDSKAQALSLKDILFRFVVLVFKPYLVVLSASFWLCTQWSLLVDWGISCEELGKSKWAACEASALTAVLFLQL